MTPTLTFHGNTATLEADGEFVRFLLTEARRSGQAQLGAFGVSTAWRAHWTNRLASIDQLLRVMPTEACPEPMLVESDDDDIDLLGDL